MFNFNIFNRRILSNPVVQNLGMDNKKTRFSPSSIDEIDRNTITRLIGTENRYDVPEHFKGRTQTLWDSLATAFPLPNDSNIQSYVRRFGLQRPVFDCFLPPSYTCICYKCLTLTQPDIRYFHEIMSSAEIEGSDSEYRAPRVRCEVGSSDAGMTNVIGNIQHVAHFYTEHIFVPGYATYDEPPSTPTFSKVKFDVPESTEVELKRKWVRRMRITPTRLFL